LSLKTTVGGWFEPYFISGAAKIGRNLVQRTRPDLVLGLIEAMRPVDCGKPLIRIGGKADGGYLVPDDLDGIEYCFSPGVNTIADFENDLADRKIKSFMADYSVDAPPISRPELTFDKKFLGATDNEKFFTLASWKDKYLKDYSGDLILQMDIDGGEYQVIFNTPDQLLCQFRILVIEFHGLDKLLDPFTFELLAPCFKKVLDHFHVVHLHPNNCCGSELWDDIEIPRVMEFTFLNKKRAVQTKPQRMFPHPLDAPNLPKDSPDVLKWDTMLPKCWYL
jgi:hypothetical protein